MRFFSFMTSLLATGLVTGALAAPGDIPSAGKMRKRGLPIGQVIDVINNLNQQASVVKNNVDQAMNGVSIFSSQSDKDAAGQKVSKEFATLKTAFSQAETDLKDQSQAAQKRQYRPSYGGSDASLIGVLGSLVNLTSNLVISVVNTVGVQTLAPVAEDLLGTLGSLLSTVLDVASAAVPVVASVGILLGGIGGLLSGIGGLIP